MLIFAFDAAALLITDAFRLLMLDIAERFSLLPLLVYSQRRCWARRRHRYFATDAAIEAADALIATLRFTLLFADDALR